MDWKERLDKLLSREFLGALIAVVLFSAAFFARDRVEFGDFAFWISVATGIGAGALTVQKVGGGLLKRGGGEPPVKG